VRELGLPIAADELRRRKEPVYHAMLRDEARLMPGAAAAIERLAAEMPLAVATNSTRADLELVLDPFDLRRHFAAVVTREDYTGRKPAPDAFLVAAERLGLPPGRCVVIEDATKGVLAAERAGCPCIAIPHRFTAGNDFTHATVVLESLDRVTGDLVREIVAGAGVGRSEK
jgi:HAD superfamily hydrolase (TIGR01509 family)